ncbi:MAG: hypothetical protein ABSA05_11170 [Opitutaceae bacterium]|jgi:hypothetical protein
MHAFGMPLWQAMLATLTSAALVGIDAVPVQVEVNANERGELSLSGSTRPGSNPKPHLAKERGMQPA